MRDEWEIGRDRMTCLQYVKCTSDKVTVKCVFSGLNEVVFIYISVQSRIWLKNWIISSQISLH